MTFPASSLFDYDLTARIQFMFTKASGSHSQVGLIGAIEAILASCHLNSQTTMATPLLWPCELVLINRRQKTQEEGSKEENA